MIDYCYHTHTPRCGHATGSEKEFVEKALEKGLKVLGFSDHMVYPGFHLPYEEEQDEIRKDYYEKVNVCKEEYKDRIEIHLGYETEYDEIFVPYYKHLLDTKQIEYLICGQHWVIKDGNKIGPDDQPDKYMKIYTKKVVGAIKSGLFKYIAHPDMPIRAYSKPSRIFISSMNKICKVAKKYNVPLEINLNGIRYNQRFKDLGKCNYTSETLLKIMSKHKCDVIVGVDAHHLDAFETANYDWALQMIEKYNLHLITRLKF